MIGFYNVSDVTVKEQKKDFCKITAGNQASCPTDQGMVIYYIVVAII